MPGGESGKGMAELGRLGGRKSGTVRRRRGELQDLARKLLGTRFTPSPNMTNALRKVGIELGDRVTLAAGILSVVSGKALTGDLKAARFVMEIAGYTPDAKERIAKTRTLERMLEGNADGPALPETPSLSDMEAEAERMGVYGDG